MSKPIAFRLTSWKWYDNSLLDIHTGWCPSLLAKLSWLILASLWFMGIYYHICKYNIYIYIWYNYTRFRWAINQLKPFWVPNKSQVAQPQPRCHRPTVPPGTVGRMRQICAWRRCGRKSWGGTRACWCSGFGYLWIGLNGPTQSSWS